MCYPHENARAAFLDFSTLRPIFKKSASSGAAFTGSVWTILISSERQFELCFLALEQLFNTVHIPNLHSFQCCQK